MYPSALALDAQRIYKATFKVFAERFNAQLFKTLKQSVRTDAAFARIAFDSDIFQLLAKLKQEHGDDVPSELFQRQIAQNAHLVNAFSRAQFNKSINGVKASLSRKPEQKQTLPTVDVTRGENIAREKVDSFVKSNVNLIKGMSEKHAAATTEIVRDGVLHGKSNAEIIKEIVAQTQVNESQAQRWADDQVGKLFADLAKERQTSAGFPGYIWRTQMDSKVRTKHRAYENTFHLWSNPPAAGSADYRLHVHPGQDFNCRCWAEPAMNSIGAKTYEPDPIRRALMARTDDSPKLKDDFTGKLQKPIVRAGWFNDLLHELTMPRQDRLNYIAGALSATWDAQNLAAHEGLDENHDFSERHMSLKDVSTDILTNGNYDEVFLYKTDNRRRVAFYSDFYGAMVVVDIDAERIASCFKVDDDGYRGYEAQYIRLK